MIIKHSVPGSLWISNDVAALRLAEPDAIDRVYLAYALVTQGPEHQILPSVLLDDWGNEVGNLKLYGWIRENGFRFPRAEVFGESPTGAPVQFFLRDLELLERYPVYAYTDGDMPTAAGVRLRAILLSDESVAAPLRIAPPDDVSELLRQAQVDWWRVGPHEVDLGFIT
jgi:hypothetical protein